MIDKQHAENYIPDLTRLSFDGQPGVDSNNSVVGSFSLVGTFTTLPIG